MIQEAGVLQPLKMQSQRQMSVKWWHETVMADELNMNKEMIHQILHEDLRKREGFAKFVPHRLTDGQKYRRLESCQAFIQT
jgi:hypothetical protein